MMSEPRGSKGYRDTPTNFQVSGPGFWRRPLPLGLTFITTGTLHFLLPEFYLRIIPRFLPQPRVLVYLSGAGEMLGGVGILLPAWRRPAGLGLILLLLAVFPANVQMLINGRAAGVPLWAEALLWLRLPLQAVLIAWVWRVRLTP